MVSLDKLGILRQNLLELNRRYVFISLTAAFERFIIFLNRLINRVQLVRLCLKLLNILGGYIVIRHDILADDPFAQRRHRLAGLKIDQPQKISRLNVQLIKLQASLQQINRSGQIADLRLLQPLVIVQIGKLIRLALYADIASALRTVIRICEPRSAVHTVHSYPSQSLFCCVFIISLRISITSVRSRL